MNELKEARMALSGAVRCAAVKDGKLYTSAEKGLRPLLLWLRDEPELLCGACVADKIVGRAAAMLMIYAGVREVFASVISNGAISLLRENGIDVSYSMTAIAISNRRGDGICPMERAIAPVSDPETAYKLLLEKVFPDN